MLRSSKPTFSTMPVGFLSNGFPQSVAGPSKGVAERRQRVHRPLRERPLAGIEAREYDAQPFPLVMRRGKRKRFGSCAIPRVIARLGDDRARAPR
jgi:hypothetical protein